MCIGGCMRRETSARNERLLREQPAREANVARIVEHFRAGAKSGSKALGIELEHFCVDATGRSLSYSEPGGVRDVLHALEADYPQTTIHEGDLLGVARPGAAVTIEPAAQLELSAGPFEHLSDAAAAFDTFEADVTRALAPVGGRVLTLGYDPSMRACDKELIPKARYTFMNRYLSDMSPWGPRMMRGSASTQVSIDYRDEADAVNKMRVASVLAPLFALLCDNAPTFEGAPRPHACMRTEIWKWCDPDRCGTVPGLFDEGFGFEDYAAYLLDVPAIVALDEAGEARCETRSFSEIYAERVMDDAEVLHAMSMVFPDVRLKSYVEIRPADAMPVAYVVSYAALVKGLFYCDQVLDRLVHEIAGIGEADIVAAKEAVMARGYAAEVYGRPVAEALDVLLQLALVGLDAHERGYLKPLSALVYVRETLADRADVA